MKIMARALAAMALVLAASLPVLASPEGLWEIESGDSRYKVTLCGDGTQLCAELVWLGNGADNAENLPYLNTLLIDRAPQTAANEWKGTLHLYGQQAGGTITQTSDTSISLQGCFMFVVCRTYQMYRIGD
ncbi:hypothetical protein GCM10007913_05770 [Devosia yakushimensis]|uniref:DUF2147 domain-containing protein n=1 Tax=Devosia yakushimensis TaxID=470028 RepID=A0ABQ5UA83_9HYPH|nr:hypothetical protein [Devosia yakushimensis]GLQ08645.1 hypothetical protein GCM10007913_05770 [Devosia yakushimensis]